MSQNYRVAMEGKLPCIFLAHPQNRKPAFGLQFTVDQYMHVKGELEKIAGKTITDDDLRAAIKVMNKTRAARRAFVKLASDHCDVISAVKRSAVLRAAWFMEPAVYAEKLEELNAELEKLPVADWKGSKIVTSGIICDNPKLLQIFDDNKIAIAADDVAQESRAFRVDASEEGDPMMALAQQFADQDYDVLLYDEHSNQNRRGEFVVQLVKDSGAQGLVLFMQQFCDPRGDGVSLPEEGPGRCRHPPHQAGCGPADAGLRPGQHRHPGLCRRALREGAAGMDFPSVELLDRHLA